MSTTTTSNNEHFGKIVRCQLSGVDLELIFVKSVTETTSKCYDRTGTGYTVRNGLLKPTGEKVDAEEVERIMKLRSLPAEKLGAA